MVPSFDSAGAQFITGFTIVGSPAAAATPTQVPLPFGVTRAMPLTSPAGLVPVTWKPKKMLPCASAVSGVLMKTVASNAAGLVL